MARAFAERELERRGLDDRIEVLTGGTDPADSVHDVVIEAMRDGGIDLGDRVPREITPEELRPADVVVTMGCSTDGVCPAAWTGDARDWDLDDPHGRDFDAVRLIRDDVEHRVIDLVDELETEIDG